MKTVEPDPLQRVALPETPRCCCYKSEGGGQFESRQSIPPPSRPPQVFKHAFLHIEIFGKSAKFCFWPPEWAIFFFTPCV